jgi:hypothetical protein
LNSSRLAERIAAAGSARSAHASEFVELDVAELRRADGVQMVLRFVGADGERLRIDANTSAVDLIELALAFWSRR